MQQPPSAVFVPLNLRHVSVRVMPSMASSRTDMSHKTHIALHVVAHDTLVASRHGWVPANHNEALRN
jgi:hypothetical protein